MVKLTTGNIAEAVGWNTEQTMNVIHVLGGQRSQQKIFMDPELHLGVVDLNSVSRACSEMWHFHFLRARVFHSTAIVIQKKPSQILAEEKGAVLFPAPSASCSS